jgi:hypothetical protein
VLPIGIVDVPYEIAGSAIAEDYYPLSSAHSFTLKLVPGWNFVSIPLVGSTYNASTLGLLAGDEVASWNSSLQTYDLDFIVGLSPLTADFRLNDSTGYWIYASAYEDILLIGGIPTFQQSRAIDVPVGGGWVVIGFNHLNTTKSASDVVPMFSGGSVTDLARWNTTTGQYDVYIVGIDPSIYDFIMSPGEAYWIWVTASGTLAYDP